MNADVEASASLFLADGGEMGALMRVHDWASTPLGSPNTWSQPLRCMVATCLNSPLLGTVLWGPDLLMLYNDAYIPSMGERHPAALGRPVREVWGAAWGEVSQPFLDTMATGTGFERRSVRLEITRHGKSETTWWDFSAAPIRDEAGRIVGLLNQGVETTVQVRALEASRAAEERYALALAAGGGIGAWDWDVLNDRVVADDRFAHLYGVDPAEAARGVPISQFFQGVHPEDRQQLAAAVERSLLTGVELTEEYRIIGGASGERWVAARGRPHLDASGRATRFPGVTFDITVRQLSKAALELNEARNRQILDSAIDYAIIATDLNGLITRWNEGARRVLGWTEAEMLGQPTDCFFIPEDVAAGLVANEMRAALQAGRNLDERWHQRKGGERFWASGEITALKDEAGATVGFVKVLRDRTEQQLADETLRASEARLSAIVRATSEVLYSQSPDWSEMRQLTGGGYLADTGTANPHWLADYIPPEEQPRVKAAIAEAIQTRSVFDLEHRVRLADGGVGWTQSRAVPLFGPDGEISEWFGAATDVTAQREAEVALRRLNETLEQRVEARTRERDRAWRLSQDLLVVAETNGSITAINTVWTALLGWTDQDLVGKAFVEFTHPDDLAATLEAFSSIIERPLTHPYEYRFRHKDGTYRWFAWTGAFEDGRVYASGRDVTHDREREAVLRDTQDFARLALSAVGGVGVWTYDMVSDLFSYDNVIADIYGIAPALGSGGISRLEFLRNVHSDDRAALNTTMAEGLVNPGDLELEYRIRHPDGRIRWVLSRGHTYHDQFGVAVRRTGVGVETTKQRETEDALRQSQKMEAVGQLTGGLAHDFNNLLTGVTGSLELLQTRIAQGRVKDVDRYVNAAQGAAKRAAALTHRLLAFSRRQTLDPKPTDVNRLIAGMEELIRRTVGPEIAVEAIAAGGLWATLVDPGQLENALLNLSINARDAMPGGGRITIETCNKWLDERAARERELPAGHYVTLCVSDTGTGMAPDVIGRAFDPFFTTKPIGQGTGLGLSMIYGFARQSGGQARIYSEVGQGTMVCLYLPRYLGAERDVELPPELAEAPRAEQGETVLVVDDEPTVRMLVTEVLEDLGYTAIEAADGVAGIKVLQSDVRIDLLVTDVGLPGGMNGRQMADAARVIRPHLKVLFITGYAENAVLSHGHLDPGMHVLTKPFAMEALASRIRELIAGP